MPMPAEYLTKQKLVLRSTDEEMLLVDLAAAKNIFPVRRYCRKVGFAAYELASGETLLVSVEGTLEKQGSG